MAWEILRTCQADRPVATTMKSAKSQCLGMGKTLTLSALTSLRIASTSSSFSNSPLRIPSSAPSLVAEEETDRERLRIDNPSFHCWVAGEEAKLRDFRTDHIGISAAPLNLQNPLNKTNMEIKKLEWIVLNFYLFSSLSFFFFSFK